MVLLRWRRIILTQDGVGGDITISCERPSGSTFPIGTTEVECTAIDAAGNTATASFTITVQDTTPVDTTPPTLTVPDDITEEATGPDGATVSFVVSAQDDVDGSVSVTCTPASGSTFEIGTTTVTCTAIDAAGNRATASFTITVNPITCEGETATIVGTSGNDVLPGTDGRDVIAGLGGNDEIQGLGGNDLICGNEGADRLSGGDGNDDIFGGNGNDNLDSRDGVVNNDNLDGGNGNNDTCLSDPDPEVNCELD